MLRLDIMKDDPIYLRYNDGTIIAENVEEEPPENFVWDARVDKWRALGIHYGRTVQKLREEGVPYHSSVPRYKRIHPRLKLNFALHYYQAEALQAWIDADCRGSVVLPTGAGKSFLALKAIEYVGRSTLVVAPTIDLLNQWYDVLTSAFEVEIGILGGGYHELRDITVATYDSAYIYCNKYGNRFAFLIFDEVHHLPAPSYSHIPQLSIASRKLGLTATYERLDQKHNTLKELIGDIVYRKSIDELRGEYLSDYETIRLSVQLTPEEKTEYDREHQIYTDYIRAHGLRLWGRGWREFVRLNIIDPKARRAMLALNRAKAIALGAEAKLNLLESLLKQHGKDRLIIFTENNALAYNISQRHLIPAITHQTKTKERKRILDRFRTGEYHAVVTSKVLNEGVNVPEASVAVVLSGSGSQREYAQRLGRILRKREGKFATLYEVITQDTMEKGISQRRRRKNETARKRDMTIED